MNIPVLFVALIISCAVLAHFAIGTRETATLEPNDATQKRMASWVQAMSAWQMLTVDLLIILALLFTIALSDVIAAERWFILGLAGYFLVQAAVWFGHVVWLNREGASLKTLPHWALWLLCAGLLLLGRRP